MLHSLREFIAVANGEPLAARDSQDGQVLASSTVVSFQPLREALVRRDAPRARHYLRLRRQAGQHHWQDDLVTARVCLLEGDRTGALAAFSHAEQGAMRAEAQPRLELELRLARELSLADLIRPEPPLVPIVTAPGDSLHRLLIGSSVAAVLLRDLVRRLAASSLPVLIMGDTGVGKDVVARALHQHSPRSQRPFVAVACTAINDSLLEAELFGHQRGAFSGADADRPGLVTAAADGTLFLDEIGDASPRFQAALLRLLDAGDYRPVGAITSRTATCRVVAATNVDLAQAVAEGRFRRDLYHRLRRHEILVPPLSTRRDDIAQLAVHFLNRDAKEPRVIDRDLAAHLRQQSWPGNVRELRNAMENLAILTPERHAYTLVDFQSAMRSAPSPSVATTELVAAPIPVPITALGEGSSTMRQNERAEALFAQHHRLTRKEFASLLGISLGTATTYLKRLCADGVVRKIEPSGSPMSHYFETVRR